jgi:hypothetical protein
MKSATLAAILALAGCGGQAGRETAAKDTAPAPDWPPLPTTGYVSGRAAVPEDIGAGNAVFVAEIGGQYIGEPLDIEVPQYALHVDAASQHRTRVIIIQAERAAGIDMVGYRTLAGEFGAATLPEFELLGRHLDDTP